MSCSRIQTNAVEPIQAFILASTGLPLTGLTDLYVRIRRESDGYFLDWNDATFKASGWTTINQVLTELNATYAAGLYGVTGGLDFSTITNKVANDFYQVYPLQTPGTTARLPGPSTIIEGQYVDNLDAAITSRATQADILSDATPFDGADVASILTDTAAIDSRLPTDPADESNQLAQHAATQSDIAALENVSAVEVENAVWDATQASHVGAGSTGKSLEDAGSAVAQADKIDDAATTWPPTPGSLLDRLTNKDSSQTYDASTDSLEGIRDRIA